MKVKLKSIKVDKLTNYYLDTAKGLLIYNPLMIAPEINHYESMLLVMYNEQPIKKGDCAYKASGGLVWNVDEIDVSYINVNGYINILASSSQTHTPNQPLLDEILLQEYIECYNLDCLIKEQEIDFIEELNQPIKNNKIITYDEDKFIIFDKIKN